MSVGESGRERGGKAVGTNGAVAITGGARGIGEATARAFAAQGFRVAIGDIDAELVKRTATGIGTDPGGGPEGQGGGRGTGGGPEGQGRGGCIVVGLPVDVTDPAGFAGFLREAEAALGGLDVLVNNAGIMPTYEFLDEPDAVTDRQLDINIRGVMTGTRLAGRRFAARGDGHIVNLASVAGHAAAPGVATYCATKFAVVGLGTALHQELAPKGVRVSTICPALVDTELISGLAPGWLIRQIGYVQPDDVAAVIVRCVRRRRGGVRFVPRVSGATLRTLSLLPENARNRVSGWLGMQRLALDSDESVRRAYRDRTEHLDLAPVRDREGPA